MKTRGCDVACAAIAVAAVEEEEEEEEEEEQEQEQEQELLLPVAATDAPTAGQTERTQQRPPAPFPMGCNGAVPKSSSKKCF